MNCLIRRANNHYILLNNHKLFVPVSNCIINRSMTTSPEHQNNKKTSIQVSPVMHDPSNNRFTCDLVHLETQFKGKGILSYREIDNERLKDYDHVEIPSEFKGHDLGKVLANAAFDHALNHGWKLKVTCPYLVRKFLTLPEVKQKYENIVVEPEMK